MTESDAFASDGRYFAAIAESYDRLQPIVAGPAYRAGLDFVLDLLPHEADDAFVCVELGCGTAALTEAVLQRFPRARCVATDSDRAMLEVAQRKLGPYGGRAEVCEANIVEWEPPACDVALSSFVFHHIAPERLRGTLRRIAGALSVGGCVIVLDTMRVGPRCGERVGAQSLRLRERHTEAAVADGSATRDEIAARWELKRKMKAEGRDVEYSHTAESIVDAMREAGFEEAGLVWRQFSYTILVSFLGGR